jgi:hypothetical protein
MLHTLAAIVLIIAGAALVALWVVALISILKSELIAPLVKALWVLAIVTFSFVGPIVWFIAQRYQRRQLALPVVAA